jgi:hypothetical protein
MLFAWIVFDQLPDLLTTAGMLIIGGSCLSIALYQPKKLSWTGKNPLMVRQAHPEGISSGELR